ncbi:MAG: 2-hydroxyacyl-CoA dehydratase [Anaerolineales bacterium]|jgi:benzoyl-CoA reductase/2-hydroxyglutaryl-CoA dehydratase subunit BcrC/BadD/HgdB
MKAREKAEYYLNARVLGPALLRGQRWAAEARARGASPWASSHLAPPLSISPRLKELVARHWLEGRYANVSRRVAWVTSGAPVEFLKALDFFVLYPENHGAICGTARCAVDLATFAEEAGYSRDICSYARTDLGSLISGRTPVGRLPRPDLLLACTNICQTVLFWYWVLANHFRVPLIVIDTPFVYREEASPHSLDYVRRQIEEAIPVAERVAGKVLNPARFDRVGQLSREACFLWLEILERNRHEPAPITAFDEFVHMAPIVEMRGEAFTVDFYAAMLEEVDRRIARGISAVRPERRRLLWDNLPIWYRLRYLAEQLAERGVAIVASTYTNAWGELAPLMDPDHPLESMVRAYTYPVLNRGTGHKLSTMERMIRDYHLDGVILHSDRSCKPYSIGQMDQRDQLVGAMRTPALLLEADHNDSRCFSEEQVSNRLAAFLEMLGV